MKFGFELRWRYGAVRLALLALLLAVAASQGQTLAHKGWVGDGITMAPWWQGAVLYQIDPVSFQDSKGDGFGDLNGIVERLDYLQGLGVDAVLLAPFQLQAELGHAGGVAPFDAKYGSEEDLDKLVREAGARKIRVFVDLPLSATRSTQEQAGVARFWLSRGIAGLRLTEDSGASFSGPALGDRVRELRRIAATYAGQRVLLWDSAEPVPAAKGGGLVQMVSDSRLAGLTSLGTTELRKALQPVGATAGAVSVVNSDDGLKARSFDRLGDGAHNLELAKVLATALIEGGGAPLLYFGQEIGMATTRTGGGGKIEPTPMQWGGEKGFTSGVPWIDMGINHMMANVALEELDAASLLNWYRRLIALHHTNASLRTGTTDAIADGNPDVVAWVRRGPNAGPVVVVCNLTNRRLLVPVAADLRRLGLSITGGMLHTLTSTELLGESHAADGSVKELETGPVSMYGIAVPPFGVYIGELPRQAAPEPSASPRSGRRSRTSR